MTIQRPRLSLPCRSWRGCPYLMSLCSPALRGARSDTHTILSPSSRPWRCWIDVISPFLSRLINELSFVPRTSFDMVAASHTAVDYRMWLSLARYYYIGSNNVTDLTCYYILSHKCKLPRLLVYRWVHAASLHEYDHVLYFWRARVRVGTLSIIFYRMRIIDRLYVVSHVIILLWWSH